MSMVNIKVIYEGQLHCHATHGPSGQTLQTDAPLDNKGRGESFSPTDLLATGLASCIATIMAMKAEAMGIDLTGMTIEVDKIMTSEPPRRIAKLPVRIQMPIPHDAKTATIMANTAKSCPAHQSLHPDIEIPIEFSWR